MTEIVIAEFMDQEAVDWLAGRFAVTYDPDLFDSRAALFDAGAAARGLIVRNRTRVDGDLIAACPALRVVGRLGVGLDNIDLDACRGRGIAVMPAAGGNTVSVAEYVVAAVLMLRRGAYHGSAEVLAGKWPRQRMMGSEVAGATLGLLGFGATARATAERARSLGMRLAAYDPFLPDADLGWEGVERFDDVDSLLAVADAVSLHVPLNAETRNLIDARRIDLMREGAVLVNTARGGIIDELALAAALRSGRLAGAALDVFADEPLPSGSSLVDVPNLIVTPHIAGVTHESNTRISWITVRNVAQVLGARE